MANDSTQWIIGASINICGSIGINFGTNLIKFSHTKAEKAFMAEHVELETNTAAAEAIKTQVSGSGTTLWQIGISIFTIGNLLNFVSYSFGNQSLLSALGSVQFITNVAFGYFVLDVAITHRTLCATAVIVFGNTLIVVFSDHQTRDFSTEELLQLYDSIAYQVYLWTMIVVVFVLQCVYTYLRSMQKRFLTLQTRLTDPLPLSPVLKRLVPLLYALVSGIIGTQSVVLAKSLSEIFNTTLRSENQFKNPATYLIVICWLITVVFWLRRMNRALQRFEAVFIIPILQVVWIVFSIISGGLYFQEFNELISNPFSAIMFFVGVLLILVGCFLLAPVQDEEETECLSDATTEHVLGSRTERSQRINLSSQWGDISIAMPLPSLNETNLRQQENNNIDLRRSSHLDPVSKLLAVPSNASQSNAAHRQT